MVRPGRALDSWITVGIPIFAPAFSIGQQTYPPVPIITFGFSALISALAALRARIAESTPFAAFLKLVRLIPLTESVASLSPVALYARFSSPPSLPTKRNSASWHSSLRASYMAIAGLTCPPVPPPQIINFIL